MPPHPPPHPPITGAWGAADLPRLLRDGAWALDSAETLTASHAPPYPSSPPLPLTSPHPAARIGRHFDSNAPAWAALLGGRCWPCFLSLEPRTAHPTSFAPLGGALDSLSHRLPPRPSLYRQPQEGSSPGSRYLPSPQVLAEPSFLPGTEGRAVRHPLGSRLPAGFGLSQPAPGSPRAACWQVPSAEGCFKSGSIRAAAQHVNPGVLGLSQSAEEAEVQVAREGGAWPMPTPCGPPLPQTPTGSESPPLTLFSPPAT